jgi:hypothetical protein
MDVGTLLQLLFYVALAVWVFSKLDKSSALIGSEMKNLSDSIDNLGSRMETLSRKQQEHEVEIALLKQLSGCKEPL